MYVSCRYSRIRTYMWYSDQYHVTLGVILSRVDSVGFNFLLCDSPHHDASCYSGIYQKTYTLQKYSFLLTPYVYMIFQLIIIFDYLSTSIKIIIIKRISIIAFLSYNWKGDSPSFSYSLVISLLYKML